MLKFEITVPSLNVQGVDMDLFWTLSTIVRSFHLRIQCVTFYGMHHLVPIPNGICIILVTSTIKHFSLTWLPNDIFSMDLRDSCLRVLSFVNLPAAVYSPSQDNFHKLYDYHLLLEGSALARTKLCSCSCVLPSIFINAHHYFKVYWLSL